MLTLNFSLLSTLNRLIFVRLQVAKVEVIRKQLSPNTKTTIGSRVLCPANVIRFATDEIGVILPDGEPSVFFVFR